MVKLLLFKMIPYLFFISLILCQELKTIDIGTRSKLTNSPIQLELFMRIQNYKMMNSKLDKRDQYIQSPKSAQFSPNGKKLYVQSLEGFTTTVYSVPEFERLSIIKHQFNEGDKALFKDETLFDYKFQSKTNNQNVFKGKPVEAVFSHNGKYLWVTYYRRSFDQNAVDPSALAIIDTESDNIVRVMPTGPLPKMIARSPDNKFIAVTHWGDNTIGLIDISSNNLNEFKYLRHLIVGKKLKLTHTDSGKVDRDKNCGYCLRGTVFLPDNNTLLVGRMGGGGIAAFDIHENKYLGTMFGMSNNVRHILADDKEIILSANINGTVQKLSTSVFIEAMRSNQDKNITLNKWSSVYVGIGARTISLSPDGKYVFAAINNLSKITIIDREKFKVVNEIEADSYPVGMDISPDGKYLVVTSQGRKREGGNSVMIFRVIKN